MCGCPDAFARGDEPTPTMLAIVPGTIDGLSYLTWWTKWCSMDQQPKLLRSERCEEFLRPSTWQKRIAQHMTIRIEVERITPLSHSREGGNPGPLDGRLGGVA